MKLMKKIAAIGTILAGLASPALADDNIQQLSKDVREAASTFKDDISKKMETAPLNQRLGGSFMLTGIDLGCGYIESNMANVKRCLNALYEADALLGNVNKKPLDKLRDRWRILNGQAPLSQTLSNSKNSLDQNGITTKNPEITIIQDNNFTQNVTNYLLDGCTSSGFGTSQSATASRCANTTVSASLIMGKEFIKYVDDHRNAYSDQQVTDAIRTVRKECISDIKLGVSQHKDITYLFEQAVECYQSIISSGEDKLEISFQPTAVNVAQNHTLCMLGAPECVRK